MVLTYRSSAVGTMAGARARAEYQAATEIPEMAEARAAYLSQAIEADVSGQTPAIPRPDMHPAIAELLGIDVRRSQTLHEMTGLFAGLRTDHAPIPGKRTFTSTEKKTMLAYTDFTFSAPKDFSIALYAAPTAAERAILENCFIRANDALMDVVMSEIGIARTRDGTKNGQTEEPMHLACVSYDHDTSRPAVMIPIKEDGVDDTEIRPAPTDETVPADMQRHRHNMIIHVGITDGGKVASPMLDNMHDKMHEWGAIGHAFLSTFLQEHGVNVAIDSKHSLLRLPDVPQSAINLFKHRGDEGEAVARDFAAKRGLDWDAMSPDAKRTMVSAGVRSKRRDKDGTADHAAWMKRMADNGYHHRSILRPDSIQPKLDQAEQDRVAYQAALPLLQAEWERNAKLSGSIPRIMAARGHIISGIRDASDVDRVTAAFRTEGVMQDGMMTPIVWAKESGQRYASVTTELHESLELEAIELLKEAAADATGAVPKPVVEASVAKFLAKRPEIDTTTEHWAQQKRMIDVFTGPTRAAVGVGVSGSGKSTVYAPVLDAHHEMGWTSYGVTNAWRQTHGLKEAGVGHKRKSRASFLPDTDRLVAAGVAIDHAFALDPFLRRVNKGQIKLDDKTLIAIDEIAVLSTKQILDLARLQDEHGFKIIGTGDQLQCQSIGAGNVINLFRHVVGSDQVPEILETIRQKLQEDREIARLFRDGKALEALQRKTKRGLVQIVPGGPADAIQAGLAEYDRRKAANAHRPDYSITIMVSSNENAHTVGMEARKRARARGELTGPDLRIEAIDQRGVTYDMNIAVGDVVRLFNRVNARYSERSRGYFGENGTTATIVGIDGEDGLRLKRQDGKIGAVSWGSLRGIDSPRIRLAYGTAVTIDAKQSATETDAITILPGGSQEINAFKLYAADTRNREDSVLVTSHGAEKQEVIQRRPAGDPWIAAATDEQMQAAILENMGRNLSKQPVKQLAVDMISEAAKVYRGSVNGMQAAWHRTTEAAAQGNEPDLSSTFHAQQEAETAALLLGTVKAGVEAKADRDTQAVREAKRSARRAPGQAPKPPKRGRTMYQGDARAEFAEALRRAGFVLKDMPVMDGRWRGATVIGDRGREQKGRYVGYLDGRPAGAFVNHRTHDGGRWKAEGPTAPQSVDDRRREEREREERERRRQADQAQAERRAYAIWMQGRGVRSHAYTTGKGVNPEGLRQDKAGNLVVPMRDEDGRLRNVQTIIKTESGSKKLYQKNAPKQGMFAQIGRPTPGAPILIAEGWVTGRSLHEATGLPVRVAFDSSNLLPVAMNLRSRHPDVTIIMAADNDHHLPRRATPLKNEGLTKAEAAALAVGGVVVAPRFGEIEQQPLEEGKSPPTDWNDFAKLHGNDRLALAVKEQLKEKGIILSDRIKRVETPRATTTQAQRDAARQAATQAQQTHAQQAAERAAREQAARRHNRRIP